jgi:hypothetical protein
MSKLNGILEICEYFKVSEATAMDMILHQELPAEKKDGLWLAETSSIDRWQKIKKGIEKEIRQKEGP